MSRSEDDDAIATYSAELTAEAELARGDLAEIEDHLRSLIGELRDAGMPQAEAIAEACRRLGEPKKVAREHARVRSPFGAKLSRARAWSAAALLVSMLFGMWHVSLETFSHAITPFAVELVLYGAALVALVARVSWARPVIVGSLLTTAVRIIIWSAISSRGLAGMPWLVASVGALAFVIPWRRGEISPAGWALVLLAPAYNAAMSSLMVQMTAPHDLLVANPCGTIAFAGAIAAGIGIVTRARWASMAAAGTALALVATANQFWDLTVRLHDPAATRAMLHGVLVVGSLAAAIVSVLAWRTARSTFGTLRGVLS